MMFAQIRIDAPKKADVFVAKAKVLSLVDPSLQVLREVGIVFVVLADILNHRDERDVREARRGRRLLAVRLWLIRVG